MDMKLKELDLGVREQVDVLVMDVEERETKTGKPYVVLKVTDGDSCINVKIWDSCLYDYIRAKGKVVKMGIKSSKFGSDLSYDADSCVASSKPMEDFIRKVPIDIQETMKNMKKRLYQISDPDLKTLVCDIFDAVKVPFQFWAAAKAYHHALYGGLLFHSSRMMKAAELISTLYPVVDNDLLVAGAFLHDIGKLLELQTDSLGVADYTVEGSLLGHSYLGMELIKDYANRNKTPQDLVLKLQHMIASHHGELQYGALTVPQTPEAELLHQLDMIDSRMYQIEETLRNTEPGTFSDKVFGLGVRIYHAN